MILLDASVVFKWIFRDEDGEGNARLYRDRHISGEEIVAVPDLFFYGIANVLATKTTLNKNDIVDAFSLIWKFDFEIFSFGLEEFLTGINLSKRYGITLYDAAYICLSQKLKCHLVTADKRLYEKIEGLKEIILL